MRGFSVALLVCLTSAASGQGRNADSAAGRAARGILGKARVDASQDIAFEAMVLPETVYVGQQATYQVGVFLSDEIRARLRRNPEFVPPEVRSMLAFDLPAPTSASSRTEGLRHYDVHVFQRALFPLTAGRQLIPAAHLNYALPLSNSFFAREESHSERTGVLELVARDTPKEGRPGDFRGAVGRLTVSEHLDARRARVGDPLTLTVSVDGTGNVTLLPRPELQVPWADVVVGDERVDVDTTAMLLRGHKDFDWVITPRQAGAYALPAVRYPFFNPYTERYELAVAAPETLKIAPGDVAAGVRREQAPAASLPIRRLYRGEEPLPITSNNAYWLVILLTPLPALLLAALQRPARRKTPRNDRTLRALASSGDVDPAVLRRAYATAIAGRVMASAAAMSHHSELVRTLRRAGVSEATARDADNLLAELDAVVFGGRGTLSADAARRAQSIARAIDVEARSRQDIAARAAKVATILLLVVATGALAAGRDATAERAFSSAVRQYDAREFDLARTTFFELAQARPRSSDAWIDFGTASWQAHDTAAAVVGWQHAVRLQPMAADVRQRLVLTPGFRDGFLGDIPPVSLTALGALGAMAWLAGWGIVALRLRRRRARPMRGGGVLLVVALLIAAAGLEQREVLSGRSTAVVISRAALRAAPALGEEAGAETIAGEVARVIGRQGVWTRLRLTDGREGWVEARWVQMLGGQ